MRQLLLITFLVTPQVPNEFSMKGNRTKTSRNNRGQRAQEPPNSVLGPSPGQGQTPFVRLADLKNTSSVPNRIMAANVDDYYNGIENEFEFDDAAAADENGDFNEQSECDIHEVASLEDTEMNDEHEYEDDDTMTESSKTSAQQVNPYAMLRGRVNKASTNDVFLRHNEVVDEW